MRRFRFASIFVALALSLPTALAQDGVPEKDAFIFISVDRNIRSFEFENFSRVTLTEDSFILTPVVDSDDNVTLAYRDFYKLQFGNFEAWAGQDERPVVAEGRLFYDKDNGSVGIVSEDGDSFLITIYSIEGTILAKDYGQVDMSCLPKGIYMALAFDGITKYTLKFHK